MRFGIAFANVLGFGTADGCKAIGSAAEAAGFDSLWTVEHVVVPKGYESEYPYDPSGKMPGAEDTPITDPLIWLTWLAAHTTTMKLATGVLILPQRNPAVLAKEVATLDQLSGGRVVLGVGAGWLAEEFAALDVPFESRGARFDAYIDALRALWTAADGPTTLKNEFVDYDEIYCRPQPVNGSVPLHIGGHSKVAARRAGRLGDGFFPGRGELGDLLGLMRESAEKAGRDPDAIEVSASATPGVFGPDPVGAVEELAAQGVHRIMIPPLAFHAEGIGPALAAFGENVISKVKAVSAGS